MSALFPLPSIGIFGWLICAAWSLIVLAYTDPVRQNLHEMDPLHQRPTPDDDTLAPE